MKRNGTYIYEYLPSDKIYITSINLICITLQIGIISFNKCGNPRSELSKTVSGRARSQSQVDVSKAHSAV